MLARRELSSTAITPSQAGSHAALLPHVIGRESPPLSGAYQTPRRLSLFTILHVLFIVAPDEAGARFIRRRV